jgi:hypothetical protein
MFDGLKNFFFGKSAGDNIKEAGDIKRQADDRLRDINRAAFQNFDYYHKNKDLFDKAEKDNPGFTAKFREGSYGDSLQRNLSEAQNLVKQADDNFAKVRRQNKYNILGDGLIGNIFNPMLQAADTVGGLALDTGKATANLANRMRGQQDAFKTFRYNEDADGDGRPDNDFLSDLGAIGETAANVITPGLAKGITSAAKIGAKPLLKAAITGGTAGGVNGIFSHLREEGNDTKLDNLLASGAIGAGVGAGFGAAGHSIGKFMNKYSLPAQPTPSTSTALIPHSDNTFTFRDLASARNALNNAGLNTTSEDALNKSFRKWSAQNHPDLGFSADKFKSINNIKRDYLNMLSNPGNLRVQEASVVNSVPRVKVADRLQNLYNNVPQMQSDFMNTKLGGILKTKKGKAGAGLAAGLLLSKLLAGNNESVEQNPYYNMYNGDK